jgi:hypothetical protein
MNELKQYLRAGESVRWQGKPKTFTLLEGDYKTRVIRNWVLSVLCGGLLLWVYVGANEHPSMGFIGAVIAIVAMLIVAPVVEAASLRKQQYFITNQRAMVLTGDKSFYFMELSEIDGMEMAAGSDAAGSLIIGNAIMREAHKQLRWQSKNPKIDVQSSQSDSNEHAIGLVFYNVDNVRDVMALLDEKADVVSCRAAG